MNVLKPNLRVTVITLLKKGISQREINRKAGIDRKTIRKYARLYHLDESNNSDGSDFFGEEIRSRIHTSLTGWSTLPE